MQRSLIASTKIPKGMHQQILETVIRDGYGMRGKSRWINEAIRDFLVIPNYPELVEIAEDIEEMSDILSVRIPEDLMTAIDRAIISVRKEFPGIEGVKSNIIRASVVQRLIRGKSDATSATEVELRC